jgi:hypothetical protein
MPACKISFVDLLIFPFDGFGGMCGDNSRNVFLLLFVVLWVLIFATLCMRAVLMLWHAFLFLGLGLGIFSVLFPFCLVVSTSSCKTIILGQQPQIKAIY